MKIADSKHSFVWLGKSTGFLFCFVLGYLFHSTISRESKLQEVSAIVLGNTRFSIPEGWAYSTSYSTSAILIKSNANIGSIALQNRGAMQVTPADQIRTTFEKVRLVEEPLPYGGDIYWHTYTNSTYQVLQGLLIQRGQIIQFESKLRIDSLSRFMYPRAGEELLFIIKSARLLV